MLKEGFLENVYLKMCTLPLHHHYIIIVDVNDDMTSVVTELNQLLEEAELVSSEQQRQREMEARADDQPVAMDTEAAEPATAVRNMMYHDIMLFIIHLYRVGNVSGHHHIVTHHPQGVGVGRVCHCLAWAFLLETE